MTFTAPLFLIGLVAIAIPIAVHLFNFRRYKKVYFSNVEKLEQIQTETRRQSTLRQLLILLCRILAITFLVLAFAQPTIFDKTNTLKPGANDVSIYIDNSFSMENSNGSTTLLELAKTKAREIIAAYGQTDRFHLITNDLEGRHFHWVTKDEVMLLIDDLQTSSASPTLSAIARHQFDFLRSGQNTNKQAYILSDFQASVSDFELFPTDSTISATLIPLESTSQSNIYIDSLAFNAPVFYKGFSVTAELWLRNDGDEDLTKIPVSLYTNNRQRAITTVDIPAHSSATATMHFTADEGGIIDGYVETTDYPITFDDRYYFTLNIRDRIKMLTVEGNEQNKYIARLFNDDSSVAYRTALIRQMNYSDLENNDIIILDELPSLSTGMVHSLHSFVDDGGTLVIIPANEIDENSYNEALRTFSAPQFSGINKARLTAATIDFNNSLYLNVFNSKNNTSDLEMPSVSSYHRLSASANTLRESIITLANGDDYLSVTPCGSGRIYLFAAPLRDANTDFVKQALFVPTLYNMALYSIRPTPPSSTLGSTLPIPLTENYAIGEGSTRLVSPQLQFEEIPDIRRNGNTSTLIPHGTLRNAGNYHLTQDGQSKEGLSFNYSRRESQMDFLGRDALTKALKDYNLSKYAIVRNVDKPLDNYLKEQMQGRRLWHWCIILALLMLALEVALLRIPQR